MIAGDRETRRSLDLSAVGAAKRAKLETTTTTTTSSTSVESESPSEQPLALLSQGELERVMGFLPTDALASLHCTCKYFARAGATEHVAKVKVLDNPAWRGLEPKQGESWLSLLRFLAAGDAARRTEKLVGLGSYHTALLNSSDGQISTCGRGFHGQLGAGDYENASVRGAIALRDGPGSDGPEMRAVAVACGSSHNAAIASNGALFTWGLASSGELGHGGWTPIELNVPRSLSCLSKVRVVEVSCGANHTAAVGACGGLWTCGRGRNGQLGHGMLHDEGPMKRVEALDRHGPVLRAAAGGTHTACIVEGGRVFTWGNDLSGQLGHGQDGPEGREPERSNVFRSVALPQEVLSLRPKLGANDPERVVHVSLGSRHTVACTAAGTLLVWGDNSQGCLGLGDNLKRQKPARVRLQGRCVHACAGGAHTAALVLDPATRGTALLTSGCNSYGQLGLGDRQNRNAFVKVKMFRGAKVESVSLGESSSSAVLADGSLYLWGRGELGQLGTGDDRSWFRPRKVL